jgi:hypothetical protein
MASILHLTLEEQHSINIILEQLSRRARQSIRLDDLLNKWGDFVSKVEQGYDDSIYEYTNDLSIRDLIEEIMGQLPQTIKAKLLPLISKADERYFSSTRQVERPLGGNWQKEQTPSWWLRIPINLKEELKRDLRSEGLVG